MSLEFIVDPGNQLFSVLSLEVILNKNSWPLRLHICMLASENFNDISQDLLPQTIQQFSPCMVEVDKPHTTLTHMHTRIFFPKC